MIEEPKKCSVLTIIIELEKYRLKLETYDYLDHFFFASNYILETDQLYVELLGRS